MTNYIELGDENYPRLLKYIKKPPKRLYYKGNIKLLNSLCFAVIGSRDLSLYGEKIEKRFVRNLSLRNITIVSGMALGADSVAHKETLKNSGNTIAVMGGGFNNIFPKENFELYKNIIENNGLVITEYEDNVIAKGNNFINRNRIISGLSLGVLVIEAKYRSGTTTTVGFAKEQGRKVFALPGRLDSKNGVGVNNIIKQGAILTISPNDIINEIEEFRNLNIKNSIQNDFVKKEYRKIYNILTDEPISAEEISIKTNNTIQCTLKLLSLMDLDDLIEEIVGAGYVKKYKE